MNSSIKYETLLKKSLKKKGFRNAYKSLEDEFTFAKEIIKLRLEAG
jgi:hypothetical protein